MSSFIIHLRAGYQRPHSLQRDAFFIVDAFCFIHLTLLLACVWLGHWTDWSLLSYLLCTVFAIFSTWLWRPVVGYAPANAHALDRQQYPEIFALIGEICAELGTPIPDVLMTPEFTAGYARLGYRQKPTLLVGHPLLSVLNREELVTILSHELAHAVDGSKTRTLFMTTAQHAIERLSTFISMGAQWLQFTKIGAYPLCKLASFWQTIAARLDTNFSADYRYAEYVADFHALTISGQTDTMPLFQKLATGMLKPVQTAYKQAHSAEKTATIRRALQNLTEHQRQNLWARVISVETPENSRHPHLLERIAYSAQFQHVQPKIVVDQLRFGRIQTELSLWPNP